MADCRIPSPSRLQARGARLENAQSYRSDVMLLAAYLFNYVALRRLPADGPLACALRRRLRFCYNRGETKTG